MGKIRGPDCHKDGLVCRDRESMDYGGQSILFVELFQRVWKAIPLEKVAIS
jgi:hypothetical protein